MLNNEKTIRFEDFAAVSQDGGDVSVSYTHLDVYKRQLLLFLFEEFYSFDEIPKALCDILDACQSGIRELEQELKKPAGKVIALPSQPALKQKEAA